MFRVKGTAKRVKSKILYSMACDLAEEPGIDLQGK